MLGLRLRSRLSWEEGAGHGGHHVRRSWAQWLDAGRRYQIRSGESVSSQGRDVLGGWAGGLAVGRGQHEPWGAGRPLTRCWEGESPSAVATFL